jgi:hypothetical protein
MVWVSVGSSGRRCSRRCIPRMLARAEPIMPASLCDHCADVSDLLSWSLSRVQIYRLCSSSEQGTNVSDAHNTNIDYLPIWSRRVSSFFYGRYGRLSKDVDGCL